MDIVTAQEMYEWDRLAIESAGMPGAMLMENAGRAVCSDLERKLQPGDRVMVLIGGGNNGGDGFVIARTLLNRGYRVQAWQVVPNEKIKGDALVHKELFVHSGYTVQHLEDVQSWKTALREADIVIDSMLGIGVKGKLRPPFDEIIPLVNEHEAYTIAVDIPSGVPADEGVTEFDGIQADFTVIIAAPKQSVFLEHTSPFYGEWSIVEIGLPSSILSDPKRSHWQVENVKSTLPDRQALSHKGSHGKGLAVGGAFHMPGSIAMTARAALRSGIGLLTIATPKNAVPLVTSFVQEAMYFPLADGGEAMDFSGFDGAAFGMGIGREEKSSFLLDELLNGTDGPLLIDADGLYHLKEKLGTMPGPDRPIVVTPHPGEFAHLTGRSIPEILASPFSISRDFACRYGVYVVLKGPNTIITAPDGRQRVDTSGNDGLAKGGSGDVLSGVLLALILQSDSVFDALANGCVIHGFTAEMLTAGEHSTRGLLAGDLIEGLSQTFRAFS
ncbi:NAD(P)H-hydrate dehydratase [Halobacillus sp. Marseille-Q1614]|uniref:NAD(P)H-hydrate dehydratase n=1 Tax=Halobacillus sp. Marseille-Q1614 TaxID=2709134 RepID=UPI00156DAD4D|nr:NAD(P)H-hydrate dehydratase [Halobacillus sp. Marseille-Q1614]